jgi:hypothetical protein
LPKRKITVEGEASEVEASRRTERQPGLAGNLGRCNFDAGPWTQGPIHHGDESCRAKRPKRKLQTQHLRAPNEGCTRNCRAPIVMPIAAAGCWRHAPVTVTRIPPYRLRGVKRGPPGEGDAGSYATPLRWPTPLPGREKSGAGGTGIMTSGTGPRTLK